MSITITSTSDSKEVVAAAMADLASTKPVEEVKEPAKEPAIKAAGEPEEEVEELDASDAEEDEEEIKEEKPKKKGGFQKRIDKLSKKVADAERDLEYWRQEALRGKAQPQPEAPKPQVDLSKRPKADDFNTADEYTEALIDWKADQKLAAKEQADRAKAAQTEVQSKIQKHQERVKEFAKQTDDWEELIESVKVPMSLTVQEAIIDSEHGPEIMYELAKDTEELKRIGTLSPIAAAKAIGRLEAQFLKKPSTKETKTSSVPAPVKTVRAKGVISGGYRDDMSQSEYNSWRAEQMKSQRV